MAFRNSFLLASVIGFVWLILLQQVQCSPVRAGDIGPGIYHAGAVGTYAGQLSAGEYLKNLYYKIKTDKIDENADFSESAAKNNPSLYESLGSLGDHLEDHEFPEDYGVDNLKAHEYEEAESQAAASEQHEEQEVHEDVGHQYEAQETHADFDHEHELPSSSPAHENEVDFGSSHLHSHDFDDFYSKPVPGIDHGKGAYSYSSTYEFKDPKP